MQSRFAPLLGLRAASLFLLTATPAWAQGNCTYQYDSGTSTGSFGISQGVTAWINAFDAGAGDTVRDISTSFGSPIGAPNATNGFFAQFCIWNDPTNDLDPADATLVWSSNAPIQDADTDTFLKIDVPDIPVSGIFWAGVASAHLPGQSPAPEDATGIAPANSSWLVGKFTPPMDVTNLANNNILTPHPLPWMVRVNCENTTVCRGIAFAPLGGASLACNGDALQVTNLDPAGDGLIASLGHAEGFGLRALAPNGLGSGEIQLGFEDTIGTRLWDIAIRLLANAHRAELASPLGGTATVRLFERERLREIHSSLQLPIALDILDLDLPLVHASGRSVTLVMDEPVGITLNSMTYSDIDRITVETDQVGGFGDTIGSCTIESSTLTAFEVAQHFLTKFRAHAYGGPDARLEVEPGGISIASLGTDDQLYLESDSLVPTVRQLEQAYRAEHGPNFFGDRTQFNWRVTRLGERGQAGGFLAVEHIGTRRWITGGLPLVNGTNARDIHVLLAGATVGVVPGQTGLIADVPVWSDTFGATAPGAANGCEGLWLGWDIPIQGIVPGLGTLTFDRICMRPVDYCYDWVEGVVTTAHIDQASRYVYDDASYMTRFEQGEAYCSPAIPNSSGSPGILLASGSAEVAANDLVLCATSLPRNQFGYFLASLTPGLIVMPGGSAGNLCLSGNIARFNGQVQNSGALGCFWFTIDLQSIPTTPVRAVQAGEMWHFQAWGRDVGMTSNFTNARRVRFY
ncbi:MAG: hypothetical protein GY711_08605 [bacterium]|nr:hypothetical protein [bacterium]